MCLSVCVCIGSPVIKELQHNPRLSVHYLPDLPQFVKGTEKDLWSFWAVMMSFVSEQEWRVAYIYIICMYWVQSTDVHFAQVVYGLCYICTIPELCKLQNVCAWVVICITWISTMWLVLFNNKGLKHRGQLSNVRWFCAAKLCGNEGVVC